MTRIPANNRRAWLKAGMAGATSSLLSTPSIGAAQSAADKAAKWPRRPVKLLVGFPAGTSPDLIARTLGEPLAQALGQPFIVENRAGASGSLAATVLAQASDEHTFGIMGNASVTSNFVLYPKLAYKLADFKPITVICSAPWLIVAANSIAFSEPAGFFRAARAAGSRWSYGSVGVGSGTHLLGELLKEKAGFEAVHVPFNASAAIVNAMVNGDIHMATLPIGFALTQAQSGRIKAVAVTSSSRTTLAPNVPVLPDAGVPALDIDSWNAVMAPAGLPRDIADRFGQTVTRIIRSEEVRQRLFAQGWLAEGSAPDALRRRIRDDTAAYRAIITRRKITVQG